MLYYFTTTRARDAGLQICAMRHYFPEFTCHGSCGRYTFSGYLQPRETTATYRVSIQYHHGRSPRVHVRDPELDPEAPHLYKDDALCLFHPRLRPWSPRQLVALTIVPWTASWLLFYEEWLRLGVWLGPEVPHGPGDSKSG